MYKLIFLILLIASTGYSSFSDYLDLNDIPDPDLREIYRQATDSCDQKSIGKALLYYKDFAAKDNDSPFSRSAAVKINRILDIVDRTTVPETMYKTLSKKYSGLREKICFEIAKNILENYPSKRTFFATKKLLRNYLSNLTLRLKISYIANPTSELKYLGQVETGSESLHKFSFDGQTYLRKVNDNLLFYKLTSYDPTKKEIELTPFDNQPYLLLQKNDKETLRKFKTNITNIILQKTIPAYFYLDSITKNTGKTYFGATRENGDSGISLDFPLRQKIKTIIFDKNDLSAVTAFSVSDKLSVYEKPIPTFDPNDKDKLCIAKLNRLIENNLWTEALGLYYLLERNNLLDSSNESLQAMLIRIRSNVISQSVPAHLLKKGIFYLKNDCFLHGWEELITIINTYPFAKETVYAHNILLEESRKEENNFFLTSANPIPFPISFMGYNKSSNAEELFQINYKQHSYFLKKGQTKGGFKILGLREEPFEKFNTDLNALDKKIIRRIKVE